MAYYFYQSLNHTMSVFSAWTVMCFNCMQWKLYTAINLTCVTARGKDKNNNNKKKQKKNKKKTTSTTKKQKQENYHGQFTYNIIYSYNIFIIIYIYTISFSAFFTH